MTIFSKKEHHRCLWRFLISLLTPSCSGYHYCTTLFNLAWTQVLRRLKTCSRCVRHLRWGRSLTMTTAGNTTGLLSSVTHTTKTNHHHQSPHKSIHYIRKLRNDRLRLISFTVLPNKQKQETKYIFNFHFVPPLGTTFLELTSVIKNID